MNSGLPNPALAFSPACERNKDAILGELLRVFATCRHVLEIGSGTGQHAVHFAAGLPHLRWQPSDRGAGSGSLPARIAAQGGSNCAPPVNLDVDDQPWPVTAADAVFSANTLHIMSWQQVQALFAGLAQVLPAAGLLCVYGPFRYAGDFTSPSNASFDISLRQRDPASGIRDFEAVDELARGIGLQLQTDIAMPANNQLIIWQRDD